jgi:hypothetical protein
MWLYAAPFYVARIAEMRPGLIVLAAIVAIVEGTGLLESSLALLS